MDMSLLMSQIAINAMVIRNTEDFKEHFLISMKNAISDENYKIAKHYQKHYAFYSKRLKSLVACQKALKQEKRNQVEMWRHQKKVELIRKTLDGFRRDKSVGAK